MRPFIQKRLAKYAKRVLRRQGPQVIAITGSVGKSSAKQAISAVLKDKFSVRVSPKNYNTEIGLPLAVLGLKTGGSSAWKWFRTLMKGCARAMFRQKGYPDILVLEMAADHKGDIKTLVDIAKPDIAVVTAVGESHAEFLGDVEGIVKEKRVLVEALGKDGLAVLCRDDGNVWGMKGHSKARVVSFGFSEEADVRALEISMSYTCDPNGKCGMSFKLFAGGSTVPVFLPYVLGRHAIYAALAATAIGVEKGMNLVEISDRLSEYKAPPGRMRFVPGIKNSVLIDDTYNAAPRSVNAALTALKDMPAAEHVQKYAVLGDMLELGKISEEAHRGVGRKAAECSVDVLVLVGELMNEAKQEAISAGMSPDRIFHFSGADEAGRFVQERMKEGDIILVKGSRGMKMEYVVKELMADPLRANEFLVGDHEEW